KYSAQTNREIVVEFWSGTNWLAQKMMSVEKGSRTVTITVDLPVAPAVGTGYAYKAHIRPVGSSWQEALDRDQINNVSV
ncbi:hypothetical protein, partial [uncultured Aquimarina sp.]